MLGTRTLSLKLLTVTLVLLAFASAQAASFGSGITYSGRIVKDENPIDSGTVRFFVWIQTQGGCDLYAEQRDIDMTGSAGTYSFEIGNGAMASSFPHTSFGIKTIADVFDNTKKTSDLDTSRTGCLTFTPNSDEGRVMKIQFIPPGEVVAQALPDLVLTAVPTAQIAFNATKVNGYGTGDLLKVDPAYTAKTTPNTPLTAAQYEEFWKLILGTSTTYLKAIPTLGGDVTGTLPAMTVVKIQNVAVTAPTTGDTGKVLTYNGTGMVWSAAGGGGGITTLNGLSVATQSFISGTTPLTISSSGSAHTFNITNASSSSSGLLTQTDWNTFNSKQSSTLGSGQVWVGNASGGAEAFTLSGDVSVSNAGVTALKAVGTAGTYSKVVTDAQGRVVSGSGLSSGDVTSALGYTPTSGGSGYVNGGNTFAGNATIGLNDAYNLGFKTNNTTKMTLTSDGKLGIGTATPNTALTIASGDITLDAGYSMMWGQSAYSFINGDSGPSSHLILGTSGSIVMTLDVNGNVGIGTNPAFTLDMGSRTDAVRLPVGNTSQRPANTKGLIRYNSSTDTVEYNNGSGWATVGSSLAYTPVNKAGDTMTGDLMMGAGKFIGLGAGSTAGTVAGQMWYDSGVIKYFDGTSAKSLGVSGSGITSLNGLTNGVQSFVVGTAGTAPAITSTGSAHTLDLPMASASSVTAGLISNSDYVSFNSKMSNALPDGQVWVGNASGAAVARTLSGDISTVSNVGVVTVNKTTTGTNNTILSLDGSGVANAYGVGVKGATSGTVTLQAATTTANYSLKLPATTPSANQVMQSDASGNLSWANALTSTSGYVNGGNAFTGNATIGLTDNYKLDFLTNNATRMTISAGGNVGIGNANPTELLSVTGGNIVATGTFGSGADLNTTGAGTRMVWLPKKAAFRAGTVSGTQWDQSSVGNYSVAMGYDVTASAYRSVALGSSSFTDANDAVAIGYSNTANGGGSAALGSQSTAYGTFTTTLGYGTYSAAYGQTTVGSFNAVTGSEAPYAWTATDPIFVVGNGASSGAKSTAMTVLKNGNVGIGNMSPAVSFDVGSKTDAIRLPTGNTSQRPSNAAGLLRYNSTDNAVEFNNGSGWSSFAASSGATGAYVNGGNSFGATANLGTNDTNDLNIKTNNATRFSFLKTGEVGISPTAGGASFQVHNGGMEIVRDDSWPEFSISGYGNSGTDYWTPQISFAYARGTKASPTYAQSGDTLGSIRASNHTNGLGAAIRFDATQTHTSSAAGTKLSFVTVPNGANVGNVAMSLAQDGKVAIGSSAPAYSLDMQDWNDAIRLPQGTTAQRPANATGLLRYNSSNSNVEFNNGSGWSALATSSGSTGAFANGGNTFAGNATIGLNDTYNLGFKTDNLTRMTITAAGNVGIGTTSPAGALDVIGSSGSDVYLNLQNTNASGFSTLALNNNTGTVAEMFVNGSSNTSGAGANSLTIGTFVSSPMAFYTNGTEKMRITSAGNIGVGNASPAVALDIGSMTDAIRLPNGTDAQRPTNAKGNIRYNTTSNVVEYNNGSGWVTVGTTSGSMSSSLTAGQMWVGNASNVAQAFALSGDISSVSNTGSVTVNKTTTGTNNTILSLDGSGVANAYGVGVKGATSGTVTLQAATTTANYSLKLPATTPAANQVMQSDASGNLSWATSLTSSTGYMNGGNTFAGNATIGLNDAYTLGFETGGSTRMTLDASGKLGIGTSAPGAVLDVRGPSGGVGGDTFRVSNPSGQTYLYAFSTADTSASLGAWSSSGSQKPLLINEGGTANVGVGNVASPGSLLSVAGNVAVGTYASSAAPTNGLIVSGNVGIGTPSPAYSLDFNGKTDAIRLPAGNTSQQPSNAAGLIRYNTTNSNVEYNNGSGWTSMLSSSSNAIVKDGNSFGAHLIIGTNDNYDFRFESNGATAMTIEPSGEVGIGTTTPGYKLDIASTDGSAIRANTYSSTASQGSNVMLYRGRGTASSTTAVQANDTLGGVYARGYGATSFGSSSTSYMEFSAAQTFTDTKRGSYMTFFTTANDSTTPTERMRIAQNGNVGIGTNNPGFTLEVASNVVDPNYATMQVTNTNATNTWTPVIAATAPNAVNGAAIQLVYGVGPTNGNRVEEAFVYHGDANAANAYSLGFYGKNDLFTILYGGNIGLGTASPEAGVQIGEEASSASPRQLYFGEAKSSGTQRPQIVGQWNSGGAWGMGPSTTAANDYRVRIGYVTGTNSDWDTSQKISLDVDGPVVSAPQAVTGATVNLAASNTITISAIGSSTITLQNMVHGGNYTLLVSDTTSRTYTFSGCNTSKFKPANTATVSGTSTMYNIITVYNGSSYDCWITWASGYQ